MNPKWNGQFSCFDLIANTAACPRSVVQVRDFEIGCGEFVVMAGPCAVESESQLLQTAEAIAGAGAQVLRGGAYKPRSSPYAETGESGCNTPDPRFQTQAVRRQRSPSLVHVRMSS